MPSRADSEFSYGKTKRSSGETGQLYNCPVFCIFVGW